MLWTRPDGKLAAEVPAYRRMMPFVMTTKGTSAVYFDLTVEMDRALELVEASREGGRTPITVTHMVLRAGVMALHEHPRLNRFIAGGRFWDRDGIWFSFSAKKAFTADAPVVVVKMRFEPSDGLEALARAVQQRLARGRSSEKSFTDRETATLLRLPGPLIRAAVAAQRALDDLNLLPAAMIEKDIFYSSAFLANLGSIGLDAAYHHLYEYGNIPIFMTLGRVKTVRAEAGEGRRRVAELRVTFDERVEDGFYAARALGRFKHLIEHPEEML